MAAVQVILPAEKRGYYNIEELGAKPLDNLRFYIDDIAADELIRKYNWENV